MLDLFDILSLPASVLLNSAIYDLCPPIPTALRARGHEIVAHGRTNAGRQSVMAEPEEAQLIRETTETIAP